MADLMHSAPKCLKLATRAWWSEMAEIYAMEAHHVKILTAAAMAWDRMNQARIRIAADGAYVQGRYGLRAHPAIAVERDARQAFARLVRELGLDDTEPSAEIRPPRLAGRYR